MDTNRFNRGKYTSILISFSSEEDRYDCLRLLTNDDQHKYLCHDTYAEQHLKAMIENSSHFLLYRTKDYEKTIVGFALLNVRGRVLDNILLCAIPNTDDIGTMVAFGVYNVAISKKCVRIVVAPRTSKLRETFLRHGYKTYHGTPGIDEVLERPVVIPKYTRTNTTRKAHTTKPPFSTIINTEYDSFAAGSYPKNANTRINKRKENMPRYYSLKHRRESSS